MIRAKMGHRGSYRCVCSFHERKVGLPIDQFRPRQQQHIPILKVKYEYATSSSLLCMFEDHSYCPLPYPMVPFYVNMSLEVSDLAIGLTKCVEGLNTGCQMKRRIYRGVMRRGSRLCHGVGFVQVFMITKTSKSAIAGTRVWLNFGDYIIIAEWV